MEVKLSPLTWKRELASDILWVIEGTKFQLQLTILIFWNKFAEKGCFPSQTGKINTTTDFCIFGLVYMLNFS